MISTQQLLEMVKEMSAIIQQNKDFLTELDMPIGDSDHGINLARGFQAVEAKLPTMEGKDAAFILKTIGMTLLSTVGGASGPLYGTAYMEAGKAAAGKTSITAEDFDAMFKAAIAGIQKRGKAEKGEKTMLDSLMPAQEVFEKKVAEGADLVSALDAACEAAREGIEYTKTIHHFL